MSQSPTERIKRLIPFLPERDVQLGFKFLERRDFDSLRDLVDSALYKTRTNLKKDKPKECYLKVDLAKLEELAGDVDEYWLLLNPDGMLGGYDDDDCEDIVEDYE